MTNIQISIAYDNKHFVTPDTIENDEIFNEILIESNNFHKKNPDISSWKFKPNVNIEVICNFNSNIYANYSELKDCKNIININIHGDIIEIAHSNSYINKILRERKMKELFGA